MEERAELPGSERRSMTEKAQALSEYLERKGRFDLAIVLMQWDLATATPKNGTDAMIDALSYFSTEVFKMTTAQEFGDLLKALAEPDEFAQLDEAMQLTVRRYLKAYEEQKRIPQEFYTRYVEAGARSEQAWREAKRASDYSMYCPHLQTMIDLTKQMAEYTNPGQEIYDVLIDRFEEGMDSATIDRLFKQVKAELVPLVQKIQKAPQPDLSALKGRYDIDAQKRLQDFLLKYIGFSFEKGTAAESEHPFTMDFNLGDVRVTNHYMEDNPLSAIFSAIHEGGHAIFGQNINPAYKNRAAGKVDLLGLHESQSRFYENILGRNIHFWEPIYEKAGEFLPQLREIPLEVFERAINFVECSMIRTEADELTYAFHIILRYEVEKAIFREGRTAQELPQLWNQKMQELLGITPANDAEGILQDIHWSDGSFGYFPSYLLGTIYDGMFLEALEKELGSIDEILAEGRIAEITKWLNEKIHWHGSRYLSKEVIERVCGGEITAEPIIRYFKEKYTRLYL